MNVVLKILLKSNSGRTSTNNNKKIKMYIERGELRQIISQHDAMSELSVKINIVELHFLLLAFWFDA